MNYRRSVSAYIVGLAVAFALLVLPGVARSQSANPGASSGAAASSASDQRVDDATLQHVADLLVPQFADHCFIDLLHSGVLIRSMQRHAGGWAPPAGTWAQVGEQIRYPHGHFCQQAMECLDTVLVANLATEDRPAPSARSAATASQVGLTSIIAAPLYARGVLVGVISVARSSLTNRTQPHYTPADRDLFGAVASWAGTAVDNADPSGASPLTARATCISQPRHQGAFLAVE